MKIYELWSHEISPGGTRYFTSKKAALEYAFDILRTWTVWAEFKLCIIDVRPTRKNMMAFANGDLVVLAKFKREIVWQYGWNNSEKKLTRKGFERGTR